MLIDRVDMLDGVSGILFSNAKAVLNLVNKGIQAISKNQITNVGNHSW